MNIKKNDKVLILKGKDRGKTGLVEKVFPAENKIVVAGTFVYKKSVKPSKKAPKGGIIEINAKIPAANVAIVCPSCAKITRAGSKISNNKKIRICQKCGASLASTSGT